MRFRCCRFLHYACCLSTCTSKNYGPFLSSISTASPPSAMVQRKASDKPKHPSEQKQSHGELERQLSSHLLKVTCDMGGSALSNMVKRANFTKASDLSNLGKASVDIQFNKASSTPIRNYMKPTSSSDARKMKKLQATVTSPAVSAVFRPIKTQSGQSSLKPVRPVKKKSLASVNRATCSSTLKNSKFPATLELIPGANKAEGNSKMRVCPYVYCSLNGHAFEPSPPLKRFISARRKLLRKLKVRPSSNSRGLEKKRKKIENEPEEVTCKTTYGFSFDVYSTPHKESLGKNKFDETSFPKETTHHMDESLDFDHDGTAWEDYEFTEDGENKELDDEFMDKELEYEMSSYTDRTESSDKPNSYLISEESETNSESEDGNAHGIKKEESLRSSNKEIPLNSLFAKDKMQDTNNCNDFNKQCKKWSITRKTTSEETIQVKEFNPRPPHFLPLEPDPEAEKVDLRHQTMDERKSAEEWMIDYALQRAVAKLCSARKRRVALLVQAFENVVPLPACDEPICHGASAFSRPRSIQACS